MFSGSYPDILPHVAQELSIIVKMALGRINVDAAFSLFPFAVYMPCTHSPDAPSSDGVSRPRFLDVDPSLERPRRKASTSSLRKKPSTLGLKKKQSMWSLKPLSRKKSSVDGNRSDSATDSTSKKPYSAITVQVERLTSEAYDEDDLSGIPDLIEVIRLQSTGPTEAARALRKKLKYGNVHRQLRALTILDGLIQNAGQRFQRVFADEPLLERLRVAGCDPVSDPDVRAKCKQLFGQWAVSYKDTPGMERIAALYRQLPQRKKPVRQQQSKVLRETEADVADDTNDRNHEESHPQSPSTPAMSRTTPSLGSSSSRPTAGQSHASSGPVSLSAGPNLLGKSKKNKKEKRQPFNLEKEKPAIMQAIAGASVASTNLTNALKLVNREERRVSDDPEVTNRFEVCKQLRRQILRYIQLVESDDFLGGLINANDNLVTALMAYEVLDKSIDDDSDSELEEGKHLSRLHAGGSTSPPPAAAHSPPDLAGLSLNRAADADLPPPKPPRPASIPMPPQPLANMHLGKGREVEDESEEEEEEDEDEDNPFGDTHAAATPATEKRGYTWKEV